MTALAEAPADKPNAPTPPPPPTFAASVQERARVEFVPAGDFAGPPDGRFKIGNRARAGLAMTLGPIHVFAQLQDVRSWGSEVNAGTGGEGTLKDFSADHLDLHQGYGELRTPFGLILRVGRQEINWHGQRLVGAVGWTDQARSFDAARLLYEGEKAGVEFFYALMLDRPTSALDGSQPIQDQHLFALRGGPRLGKALNLDGLAILRIDGLAQEQLITAGAHGNGVIGPFSYEAEAYFQGGARGASTVAAYLVGLRGGATLVKEAGLYLGGGLDLVSGDSDPNDSVIGTFETLYATNHKFYGHMDRYLNLPKNTAGAGLADGLVTVKVAPKGRVSVTNTVHFFGAMAPAGGTPGFNGVEWDIDAKVKIVKGMALVGGFSTYVPGPSYGSGATPELWSYLMTNFQLK